MKIYEVLKEMIENKKTIMKKGTSKHSSDDIYKRVVTEDGVDIILNKWSNTNDWRIGSLFLNPKDLESNDWGIYEGEIK